MTRYERDLISNGFVRITSDYEYVLGELEGNLLKFQLDFSQGGWAKEEVKIIAHELENTAKYFAEEQGLAPGMPGSRSLWEEDEFHVNSGTLYNSIKGLPDGYNAKLIASAKNSRGQYYAGHIEYGFHNRADEFVPGRPFLRPAMYAVSEATKGHVRSVMKNLIESMWQPGGYQGYHYLTFDRLITNTGRYRSMMRQPLSGKESGLKTRRSLEKLKLNTKRPNYRQRFRKGEVNESFSWDRYNRNSKKYITTRKIRSGTKVETRTYENYVSFEKQHPKWEATAKQRPYHFKPRFTAMKEDIARQAFEETQAIYAKENYQTGKQLTHGQKSTLTLEEQFGRGGYHSSRKAYVAEQEAKRDSKVQTSTKEMLIQEYINAGMSPKEARNYISKRYKDK